MIDEQAKAERGIRWVYWWLFWSPLITVPCMAFNLSYAYQPADYMWSILWSALPHLILLFGLRSPYRYAQRHTQQALMLVGLRALLTAFIFGVWKGEAWCFWVITNGALWLWGTFAGLGQVRRGEYWLMRVRRESAELPRPWAALPEAPAAPVAPPAPSAASSLITPSDPLAAFLKGRSLVNSGQRAEAVACFLAVFRSGSPELRQQAAIALDQLGEVETF